VCIETGYIVVWSFIKSDVAYVKEKEKQAQIVGPLTRRTNDIINLKLLKEIDVKVGNPSNIITGKPSNSFMTATIIKIAITVSNSIAIIIVLNFV
jgi:hypothetical protein